MASLGGRRLSCEADDDGWSSAEDGGKDEGGAIAPRAEDGGADEGGGIAPRLRPASEEAAAVVVVST
jgi:hypothetical protein